jgi:GxxExxY protein
MKHEELTEKVIGVFYAVYNELGYGFVESVYEESFAIALIEAGFKVEKQRAIEVWYHGKLVGAFKADLIVNDTILVELKAASCLEKSHEAQILNYLRATTFEVGLLLNFGPRPNVKRKIFDNDRKKERARTAAAAVTDL